MKKRLQVFGVIISLLICIVPLKTNAASVEEGTTWNFTYSASEQSFTVPESGLYELNIYGAGGGSGGSTHHACIGGGGYGGYAKGYVELEKGTVVKIITGRVGSDNTPHGGDGGSWYGGTGGSSSITANGTTIVSATGGSGGYGHVWFPGPDYRKHDESRSGAAGTGNVTNAPTIVYQGTTYTPYAGVGAGGNGKAAITFVKIALAILDFKSTPSSWTNLDSAEIEVIGTALAKEFKLGEGDWQTSNSFTIEENGTYTFYVRDEEGNVAQKDYIAIYFDRNKPVIKDFEYTNKLTTKKLKVNIKAEDQ